MTEEEIKKQADFYVNRLYKQPNSAMIVDDEEEVTIKQGFQDGAKWGMEHSIEWHDLRRNPNDLPKYKNSMMIRICWINAYGNKCYRDTFYDGKGFYWVSDKTCYKEYADRVVAWCELPQFKDKE